MKKFLDKIPLLICCILLNVSDDNPISVYAFLTAVSVSSLSQYCGRNIISLAAEAAYILICFLSPEFLFFMPLVLYDILNNRRYWLCSAAIVAFITAASVQSLRYTPMLCAYILISVILQHRTSSFEKLEQQFIESRDNSAELNMLLTEKNRHLRENQDYEIHLATLRERNRIAREIHDNVGHMLSRSILQLGALQITCRDESQQQSLAALSGTLNNAMTSVRKSVHDLHDDSVDLRQTVADAIKPLEAQGIKTDTDLRFSENIPNNIKFCLISIVKEGVSNIIKHSSADKATVILREHPAFYQLMIRDNGCCPQTISENGIGLSNMRERVAELDGIIHINSDKNGFRIFITIKK